MAKRSAQVEEASTALTVVPSAIQREEKRPPKNPGPRDRRRWFLYSGRQMPIEEIAKRENVSPLAIQNSIDLMREWRNKNSNENVALKVNELFINHLEGVSKVFGRGLNAKKHIQVGRTKTGLLKFKEVPDVATQLKTVETMKNLQEVAQPKAPLVQTNQQFNTNMGAGDTVHQPGMSFESRVRMLRDRRGLKNEEEIEEVSDAEILGETSVEDELSDIGIDLEEGDEEDNEDSA